MDHDTYICKAHLCSGGGEVVKRLPARCPLRWIGARTWAVEHDRNKQSEIRAKCEMPETWLVSGRLHGTVVLLFYLYLPRVHVLFSSRSRLKRETPQAGPAEYLMIIRLELS